jgi:hypothetical protein
VADKNTADKSTKGSAQIEGTVVGVCVVYCVNGVPTQVWLDIDQVSAISWTNGGIAARGANPPKQNAKIPTTNGPKPCPPTAGDDNPFCWWNGNNWVCD